MAEVEIQGLSLDSLLLRGDTTVTSRTGSGSLTTKPRLRSCSSATFNVTRTQISSPKKSIKKKHEEEGDEDHEFRNNYKQSVIENKNDYWRRMCWCEVQKRRKTRSAMQSIELRSRFDRFDRWERKDFRRVDWKTFYDEMRLEKPTKPEALLTDPRFLGFVFVLVFMIFYYIIASL